MVADRTLVARAGTPQLWQSQSNSWTTNRYSVIHHFHKHHTIVCRRVQGESEGAALCLATGLESVAVDLVTEEAYISYPRVDSAAAETGLFEESHLPLKELSDRLSPGVHETSHMAAFPGSQTLRQWLHSLYKFSRPHTIYGTLTSICSISLLAVRDSKTPLTAILRPRFLFAMGFAMLAATLTNLSVVGYNQLTDVRIDRVNKPYLPLASREWGLRMGRAVTVSAGALSVVIASLARSPALLAAVVSAQLLGLAYSAPGPGLRWKRSPLLAAAAIATVRGIIAQVGFFLHARTTGLGLSFSLPPALLFAVAILVVFATVISLLKDIPDVLGDEGAGVRTAAVRFGARPVFWTCVALLEVMCTAAAMLGLFSSENYIAPLVQLVAGISLAADAWQVQVHNSESVYAFYMKVWRLFYLQYLLLPFLAS